MIVSSHMDNILDDRYGCSTNLTVMLLSVWTFAVLLMAGNHSMYRVLEGYVWPLKQPRLRERQLERRKQQRQGARDAFAAIAAAETLLGAMTDEAKRAEQERRLAGLRLRYLGLRRKLALEYPEQRELVLPTRFGNVLRAFEMYAGLHGARQSRAPSTCICLRSRQRLDMRCPPRPRSGAGSGRTWPTSSSSMSRWTRLDGCRSQRRRQAARLQCRRCPPPRTTVPRVKPRLATIGKTPGRAARRLARPARRVRSRHRLSLSVLSPACDCPAGARRTRSVDAPNEKRPAGPGVCTIRVLRAIGAKGQTPCGIPPGICSPVGAAISSYTCSTSSR